MSRLTKAAILLASAFVVFPISTYANMSYSPWVHEIVQNGADMEVTVSVFDETSWTNFEGEPLPGLDAAYTLERWTLEDSLSVFEDRVFNPEEAAEVTEYTCQNWDVYFEDEICDGYECEDCDGDDVPECFGFCAVAYRFKVIDECPLPGEIYYSMYTNPPYNLYEGGGGLGDTNTGAQDIGAECQEKHEDSGCSVSGVSMSSGTRSLLGMFLSLL